MYNQTDFQKDRFSVYEDLVRDNFSFLEEIYGFEFSSSEKGGEYIIIKYLSKTVFLNLYYGSPGFELDFYIGRLGIEDKLGKQSFTSGDLLYLEGCKNWSGYSIYSAHSYNNLRECLPRLASLLKECGKACLQGDPAAYEKMLFEQKKANNRWHKQQELIQVKKNAIEAWKKKDYAKFVKLFEPIADQLTPSEYKKLEYSRKRLNQ
jgi:hypothetical protein